MNCSALLTPHGRGAIATILVCGTDAVTLVARFFTSAAGKPLENLSLQRIAFGRWSNGENEGEELVVSRRAVDRIEVHCHGGIAAAEKILSDLESQGCQRVAWEDLLRRNDADVLSTEARLALASSRTERTAAILLDQFHGALRTALINLRNLVATNSLAAAQVELERLANRSVLGLHLTNPWRVVLAGAPNVGKSSLINAILGYDRSIVFDQPGTTRDVLTASAVLHGWPIQLSDTAGLRETNDAIESQGVARANTELAQADIVVAVFDATQFVDMPLAFSAVSSTISQQKAICVLNKCDVSTTDCRAIESVQRFISQTPYLANAAVVKTSAKHRQGIDSLIDTIVQLLVPTPPTPAEAIPFLPRHQRAIGHALKLLQGTSGESRASKTALLKIIDDFIDPSK